MAVVQNPIVGRAKQKMANVIFSTWKGINTMRSKALSVANPKSEKQTEQRTQFADTVQVARKLLQAIKIGFKKVAIKQSEYNYFISQNIKFFNKEDGNVILEPQNILVSKGNLEKTQSLVAQWQGDAIQIQWGVNGGNESDKVVAVVIYEETGDVIIGRLDRNRSNGNMTIARNLNLPNIAHVYLFFYNQNGDASDTQATEIV